MQNKSSLSGTGVAIITPFKADGSLDLPALKRLVNNLANNHVDVLVMMGTTGETSTLNESEKQAVRQAVIETNNGRCKLMIGLGGNNTAALRNSIETFDFTAIDGILSVSPYYNKPNQSGIVNHYTQLADVAKVPLMLYNVPGRTGSNMLPETSLRLAEHDNICGIKEASGNLEQIMEIIRCKPSNFLIISGDDALTLPILAAGGDGVISVVANVFPLEFSQMLAHCSNNNYQAAREIHYKLMLFTRLLFKDGSPGGVKAALSILKQCDKTVRMPLYDVSDSVYEEIEAELKLLLA
jgi:4-hydroxy-tetrahydrodipicolinate synthase